MKTPLFFLTLFLTARTLTAQAQTPAYTFQDLGTLGGGYATANAINSSGQVVGYSTTADGRGRPFLYSNGVMKDLGSLYGNTPDITDDHGYANAISDNGVVVGSTYKLVLNPDGHTYSTTSVGFHYSNGVMTEFDSGSIQGINNAGQSVGYHNVSTSSYHATLYANGMDTDLGLLGSNSDPYFINYSNAHAINTNGEVVGESSTSPDGATHAFLYQNGQLQDLGLPNGYAGAAAFAISSNGLIAGNLGISGVNHAALWSNGQILDLGTLGGKNSTAYGVNSSGLVVGESDLDVNVAGEIQTAFIYRNGAMYDLAAGSGWIDTSASGINDAGQIVGSGFYNGGFHAFIATPKAVPAPSSLACFVVGGLVFGGMLVRRRAGSA